MGRSRKSGREKNSAVQDSSIFRLPKPASKGEALGFVASLIVLSLIFSYLAHKFGFVQRSILPMHGPVLLAGMILSPVYAAAVGLLTPAISTGLTGYPAAGQALRWMVELALCGAATALAMSGLSRADSKRSFIGWSARGMLAVVAGLAAALVGYLLFSLTDVGVSGLEFYIDSFFASSNISFLLLVLLVPLLGLKLRQSAHR